MAIVPISETAEKSPSIAKEGYGEEGTTMKKSKTGSKEGTAAASPSRLIDARIAELGDWRCATLARVRVLIKEADPEMVEAWKWRGVPVW